MRNSIMMVPDLYLEHVYDKTWFKTTDMPGDMPQTHKLSHSENILLAISVKSGSSVNFCLIAFLAQDINLV